LALFDFKTRLKIRRDQYINRQRLKGLTRMVSQAEPQPVEGEKPVVVFNASTRLDYTSLNAAYSLLSAWGLRLNGVPVVHFVCQQGMSRCLLGSNEEDHSQTPPCSKCTALSASLYAGADTRPFTYQKDEALAGALADLQTEALESFEFDGLPLGQLVLPSIRWRMRRHHLKNDQATLFLYREFILSAYHIIKEFSALLEETQPQAVIVFNGQMFPEAAARYAASQRGIRVFAHETGMLPFTAFITTGQATARRVFLNEQELSLNPAQDAHLDAYLEQRFSGRFSMGGIKFWQDMQGLGETFEQKAASYKQIVPVFTNVIFDTSQAHANTTYPHMFAWLDDLLDIFKAHPDTLFVLRAHPDELRPQSRKKSKETVRMWAQDRQLSELENVLFIDSQEFISSYDLIRRSKFVIAYNSSIALEAVLLGRLPVCGGWAWYADYPVVVYPSSPQAYRDEIKTYLETEEVLLPEKFTATARALLYYEYYRCSIPFEDFLKAHSLRGFTMFEQVSIQDFKPTRAPAVAALLEGLRQELPSEGDLVLTIPDPRT
jgi:hypothetical protein